MKKLILTSLLILAAGLLVACGDSSDSDEGNDETRSVEVSDAWARATTPTQDSGAIYMTIRSESDDSLIKAEVPASVAGVTEIHETTEVGGSASEDENAEDSGHEAGMEGDSGHMGEEAHGDDHSGPMMKMQEVGEIDLPAGETVRLEPGGFHIMLMELKGQIEAGDTISVTLTFEKAGEVEVDATARDE